MKTTMLIVLATGLLTIAGLDSSAQFSRGTIMLGPTIGSTGYSSANSDYDYESGELRSTGTNTFSFNIGPQIGVFIAPRFVLGATPAFSISTSHATNDITNANNSKSSTTTNTTTTTVSVGPFIRYYFTNLAGSNWFYGQINGAVGSGSGTTTGNNSSNTTVGSTNGKVTGILTWNTGASIGMTHFFYRRIGMDIAVGYNYSHVRNHDLNNTNSTNKASGNVTETTNNYVLNTSTNAVTLGVGFHWFLRG